MATFPVWPLRINTIRPCRPTCNLRPTNTGATETGPISRHSTRRHWKHTNRTLPPFRDIAEPYCLQGDALAALGRFREAIEAYTRAIENIDRPAKLAEGVVLTRKSVTREMLQAIYYNRGNAHAANGDHPSAIQDFSTALELSNERKTPLLYNRGNSKYALQRFPEAYEDFEAAWLETRRSNAALAMGNCKVLMGEFDEAMHQYRNGSARPPESAAAGCKANVALLDPLFKEIQGHEYKIEPQGFTLTIVADREPASYLCTGK